MKTRQHLFSLLFLSGILLAGCNSDDVSVPVPTSGSRHTLKLTASMPAEEEAATRVAASQKADSKNIELRWREGDKIQLYFKQGGNVKKGAEVSVKNFSNDGKRAEFDVSVPEGIDTANPFDLYGVHGAQSAIAGNTIVLDGRASAFQPLDKISPPIFFKVRNLTDVATLDVTFRHYGTLHVVALKNNAASRLEPRNVFLNVSGNPWFHLGTEQTIPVYDLVSETVSQQEIMFDAPSSQPLVPVASGANVKLAQWVIPNGQTPPGFSIAMTLDQGQSISSDTKPSRTEPLETGHAYHLYALWNGTTLAFSDEISTRSGSITFTTTKAVGQRIGLRVDADAAYRSGVWLDLNNDGNKDGGETITAFATTVYYTIGAQTVTLYGNVREFRCINDQLTALDVSNSTALTTLYCSGNELTALDVTKNTNLQVLYCPDNRLTMLDGGYNGALTDLICSSNRLTALHLTGNTGLTYLQCSSNQLEELDITKNIALTSLGCYDNRLTTLDITKNKVLEDITCGKNQLTTLDITNNTRLISLECSENQLVTLDASNNTALLSLYCYNNRLTTLNISNNENLDMLECNGNRLTTLDITNNAKLMLLTCHQNKINATEMQKVINALRDRPEASPGTFTPIRTGIIPADENVCTKAQVTTVKSKNWIVTDAGTGLDYEGS